MLPSRACCFEPSTLAIATFFCHEAVASCVACQLRQPEAWQSKARLIRSKSKRTLRRYMAPLQDAAVDEVSEPMLYCITHVPFGEIIFLALCFAYVLNVCYHAAFSKR